LAKAIIFGENKTWRGFIFGTFAGGVTGAITYIIYPESISYVSVAAFIPILDMFTVGAALGAGALFGDAIESFFKRRVGVKPGESWFPFDQTDYIAGGLIFATPFVILSFWMTLLVFVTWFCAHIMGSYLGFLLHLKDKPI
jgi:CDP-2,3-bis-(O-geranylgeranyl)-sn-glycerol synthase